MNPTPSSSGYNHYDSSIYPMNPEQLMVAPNNSYQSHIPPGVPQNGEFGAQLAAYPGSSHSSYSSVCRLPQHQASMPNSSRQFDGVLNTPRQLNDMLNTPHQFDMCPTFHTDSAPSQLLHTSSITHSAFDVGRLDTRNSIPHSGLVQYPTSVQHHAQYSMPANDSTLQFMDLPCVPSMTTSGKPRFATGSSALGGPGMRQTRDTFNNYLAG